MHKKSRTILGEIVDKSVRENNSRVEKIFPETKVNLAVFVVRGKLAGVAPAQYWFL
jgi:hypothetical protein